jgi:hypothetical protein
MEYESPITYYLKDMANVKVFAGRQTDGQAKIYMLPIRVEYRYTKSVSRYIDILALYRDTYRYVPPFLQLLLQSDLNCITSIHVKTFEENNIHLNYMNRTFLC